MQSGLRENFAGLILVIPEVRMSGLFLQGADFFLKGGDVKDTS